MHKIFWLENLKGRNHLEDLGVDGRIILGWILGKWVWMVRTDRDQWRAPVNTVMNLRVP
jgi:hypothetical protein